MSPPWHRTGRTLLAGVNIPHFTVAEAIVPGTDLLLTIAEKAVEGLLPNTLVSVPLPCAIAPFSFSMIQRSARANDAARWIAECCRSLFGAPPSAELAIR